MNPWKLFRSERMEMVLFFLLDGSGWELMGMDGSYGNGWELWELMGVMGMDGGDAPNYFFICFLHIMLKTINFAKLSNN